MEKGFRNRRRNYFIDRKFQSIFILKFCTLVIIGAVISGVIIYILSKSTVTTTFENSRLIIKSTADYILPAVLLSSVVVVIVIGLATIAITLFTSHRIAGPLYRMQKDIEEVASGNLNKNFRLRVTDELKALAESLDNMAGNLKKDIGELKAEINALESEADLERAKIKLGKIKQILSKFKT